MSTNLNMLLQTRAIFELEGFEAINFHMKETVLPGISKQAGEQESPFGSYPHDGSTLEFENVSLGFFVDEDLTNWLEMFNWALRTSVNKVPGNEYTYDDTRRGTLIIYSAHYQPIVNVDFYGCIPQSLDGLNFSTESGSIFHEASIELTYDYYEPRAN